MLEIGTGSGDLRAACIARRRCGSVDRAATRRGGARHARGRDRQCLCEIGDGAQGYGDAEYDAIVLTGSTPVLPETWLKQLKPGGRLFAVVGDLPVMTARMLRWTAPGAISSEDLFETVVKPLRNAAQPRRFVF